LVGKGIDSVLQSSVIDYALVLAISAGVGVAVVLGINLWKKYMSDFRIERQFRNSWVISY
jgi:hypothetical protein